MSVSISRGIYYGSYEPHGMPGAFIITNHEVKDASGAVPSEQISWQGPAEWIESRDGVPSGYKALWLGTRDTTRPFVVFVRNEQTAENKRYDAAYRRGWKAKRRPVVPQTATEADAVGLQDGWKASPNNRTPGKWSKMNPKKRNPANRWGLTPYLYGDSSRDPLNGYILSGITPDPLAARTFDEKEKAWAVVKRLRVAGEKAASARDPESVAAGRELLAKLDEIAHQHVAAQRRQNPYKKGSYVVRAMAPGTSSTVVSSHATEGGAQKAARAYKKKHPHLRVYAAPAPKQNPRFSMKVTPDFTGYGIYDEEKSRYLSKKGERLNFEKPQHAEKIARNAEARLRGPNHSPFTGNGWTEEKAWLDTSRVTKPRRVSPARARAIIAAAREGAVGPWSDSLNRHMTPAEHAFITKVWEKLPGSTSFVGALSTIAQGKSPLRRKRNP